MKLKVKESTINGIVPGTEVSLRTNGSTHELWDWFNLIKILDLNKPTFMFHMDDNQTEIQIDFYHRAMFIGEFFEKARITLS